MSPTTASTLSVDPLQGEPLESVPLAEAVAEPLAPVSPLAHLPEVVSGSNPLVRAANAVLNLVPQIRSTQELDEAGKLRQLLIEEIQLFEKRARELGVDPESIIGARYCLCTLLDESAAQTPWGGSGQWSRHSLLVTFHSETWGGEKFFQLLSKLAQNPQKHRDLLELMYYCVNLGLEGRFRIVDNGRAQLETLRQRLWMILRDLGVGNDDHLSPHAQSANGAQTRGWHLWPVWVVAGLAALLALGVFLWFSFSLNRYGNPVVAQLSAVHLPLPIATERPVARFSAFLEPEIREGLVAVNEEPDRSTIILRGDGLFASGATQVLPAYQPVLIRIADALVSRSGEVLVVGHTDNVPIRTARFPSNVELSQERAQHVATILLERGVAAQRIRAHGAGASQPIDSNAQAEGRSRNRRVEVVLIEKPEWVGNK